MAKPQELADCRTRDQFAKLFVRRVEALAHRSRKVDVFRDFLALSTYAISNSMMFNADHEAEYMKVIGKYDKADAPVFAELLAITVEALERLRDDFLGHVYMSQEMGIAEAGQFFTPACIADMMGQMTFGTDMKALVESGARSYVTVNDPACGGGVQLIGAYKAALASGMNPSTQLCVYAEDIDTTCVHMTYVQLSLLGLPALVSHRNTISMQTWSQWRTPLWWLQGFEYRERRRRDAGECIVPDLTKTGAAGDDAAAAPQPTEEPEPPAAERFTGRLACDVDLGKAVQADLFAM